MLNSNQLCEYLPEFLRHIKEVSQILQAESREFELAAQAVNRSLLNNFAAEADTAGIERWERTLGISPKSGIGDEERRNGILERLSYDSPYTINSLDAALTAKYGINGVPLHRMEVDYGAYSVIIKRDSRLTDLSINDYVRQRVPANMNIKFEEIV
jgi:hypothetical protein